MAARTKKLSDQIRQAIDDSSLSRYAISQQTGIAQATLSRFMSGKGGLSIDGLDKIAECIGLQITLTKPVSPKGE